MEDTNISSDSQELTSTQPLVLDVVSRLGIPNELASSGLSERDLLNYLILLLLQTQREMVSNDMWFLIHSAVQTQAEKLGMPLEKIDSITEVILKFQEHNRKSNPMVRCGMF